MNIPYSEQAFIEAAGNGDIMAVKLFLAAGMNVNPTNYGTTALGSAIQSNRTEVIKLLLDNGANPNAANGEPFSVAVRQGSVETVKLLLDKGADINTKTFAGSAISYAADKGNTEMVKLLLDKGFDPNSDNGSPISYAVSHNFIEIVKILLDKGADPNGKGVGRRPLIQVAINGNAEIVKLLLDKGADINVNEANYEGEFKTALTWAIMTGHTEIVTLLLDKGADTKGIADARKEALGRYSAMIELLDKRGITEDVPISNKSNVAPVIDKTDAIGQYIAKSTFAELEKEIAERGHGQTFPKEKLIEELIQRELLVQDAIQKQLDKSPEFKAQPEAAKKTLLTQVDVQNFIKANPVTDAEIKAEYDSKFAGENGTEYKARHILVKTEDEAKKLIAELDKGADFAKLANKNSLDAKESQNGGDLGWFVAGQMVVPFSEAVIKLDKGKYTKTPVHTQFGWHVILREDSRAQTATSLEAAKEQLIPYLQRKKVQNMVETLRKQAKIEILAPLTPSESNRAVTREPLKHPDQEVKVGNEDQQTIQTSPAEPNAIPASVSAPASAETQTKATQTLSINPTTRASSPSFDCAKASSGSEHLICSNANLAAVDVEMVQIYKKVFKNTTDTKTLKREQNQWRKAHRDACKDVACLLNVYAVRIKQLNEQQTK